MWEAFVFANRLGDCKVVFFHILLCQISIARRYVLSIHVCPQALLALVLALAGAAAAAGPGIWRRNAFSFGHEAWAYIGSVDIEISRVCVLMFFACTCMTAGTRRFWRCWRCWRCWLWALGDILGALVYLGCDL